MTIDITTTEVLNQIRRDVENVHKRVSEDAKKELLDKLSVAGPGPYYSSFDYPHEITGGLKAGIDIITTSNTDTVTSSIVSEAAYTAFLMRGPLKYYQGDFLGQFLTDYADTFVEKVKENL